MGAWYFLFPESGSRHNLEGKMQDHIVVETKKCEIIIAGMDRIVRDAPPTSKTIVCMIILSKEYDRNQIALLVLKLMSLGCIAFATWGIQADEVHDVIDDILVESSVEAWIDCVTMSFAEESFEELPFLLTETMRMGDAPLRCFVVYDYYDNRIEEFTIAAQNLPSFVAVHSGMNA